MKIAAKEAREKYDKYTWRMDILFNRRWMSLVEWLKINDYEVIE